MALTLQRTEMLIISYGAPASGLLTGQLGLSSNDTYKLADGTAAGQADSAFTAIGTFRAGEADAYFLSEGLQDAYGRQLEFTAVKVLRITADLANAADLVVGGGTWAGMFGDAGDTVRIRPGARMVWEATDANGWPVAADLDELLITSDSDASYSIIIVGVSSQVSEPAISALHPALSGVPQVGVPITATDGDWSGAPSFTYQWLRGGAKINGATGASYTPVQADLGKALSRTTFAENIAGQASATTAKAIVQPGVANTDGVMDANLNPALFGH